MLYFLVDCKEVARGLGRAAAALTIADCVGPVYDEKVFVVVIISAEKCTSFDAFAAARAAAIADFDFFAQTVD